MNYPTAWAIARSVLMANHDPRCSYAVTEGALLCDCYVITEHPDY